MLYRADWLLPAEGPPLRGGWLRVEGDRIAALGSAADMPAEETVAGESVHLEGCILLAGLVDAHCHLELTSLEKELAPGKSFPAWVGDLRARTAGWKPSDYRRAAEQGVRRLLQGGATAVLDVGNTGEALPALAESPLRALAFVETLGLDPALAAARFEHARSIALRSEDTPRFRAGVAPHAAYSCSADLLRAVRDDQAAHGIPVTLHASESAEEAELFAAGSGSLQEFCRAIYARAPRHGENSPVRWLESLGLLPDGLVLVHGNTLDDADLDVLQRRGAFVVHCPSSHAFFGHEPFPYARLRAHGIPVCLGTDSLASGDSLSMLEQARLFRDAFPEISAHDALHAASATGAQALGLGAETGSLRAGFKADFIAMRTRPASENDVAEAVLAPEAQIACAVIDGRPAYP